MNFRIKDIITSNRMQNHDRIGKDQHLVQGLLDPQQLLRVAPPVQLRHLVAPLLVLKVLNVKVRPVRLQHPEVLLLVLKVLNVKAPLALLTASPNNRRSVRPLSQFSNQRLYSILLLWQHQFSKQFLRGHLFSKLFKQCLCSILLLWQHQFSKQRLCSRFPPLNNCSNTSLLIRCQPLFRVLPLPRPRVS